MTTVTLPLKLNLDRVHLSDEQFYQLCLRNPDVVMGRTPQGILLVMASVGGDSGSREMDLGSEVYRWNRQLQRGKVFRYVLELIRWLPNPSPLREFC